MSQKIKDLEVLKAFPHWQYLEAELRWCLQEVEEELFQERDRDIKYSYDDLLKRERKVLKWLVELPDTMIDDIKNSVIEEKEEDE